MTSLGIIAEYNPFHNGHLHHITKSKKISGADSVIVVMSGNFTQRGLPACCDKFTRSKMALLEGADIVLELPTYYASSSAQYFAYGAVEILDKCNMVNFISFGSENGNIDNLKKIDLFINHNKNKYDELLKKFLKEGFSYPASQEQALRLLGEINYASKSNNILAIEYLKALKKLNSSIKPITIKRYGTDYHDLNKWDNIASASAIRNFYRNNDFENFKDTMPKKSLEIFLNSMNEYDFNYDNLSKIFNYIFSLKTKDDLLQIVDMNEELYNRIKKARNEEFVLTKIIDKVKCKNYTHTRIQRVVTNIILNNEKNYFYNILDSSQPYIRVLGFRKEKSDLLGDLVNKSSLPVIINLKNSKKILNEYGKIILEKELATTEIFNLSCNEIFSKPCNENQIVIV